MEDLWDLLFSNVLIVRVKVNLRLALGTHLLMMVKCVLKKLSKSDQRRWTLPIEAATTPPGFALVSDAVVEVFLVFLTPKDELVSVNIIV